MADPMVRERMTKVSGQFEVHWSEEANGGGSPSRAVFRLVGALDIVSSGTFREAVEPHIRPGGEIIVDMSEITFCDSTGLGAIVILYRQADAADCVLMLRSPGRRVAAVLAMTGVDRVVRVLNPPEDTTSDAAPDS
jgi:anti-sigma B factor antagonist